MGVKRVLYNLIRERKDLELISIHIPKTGGVSFRKALEEHYPDGVEVISRAKLKKNARLWQGERIDLEHKGVQALHGHFPAKNWMREKYKNAKFITWLRNPIDKIVSNYNFYLTQPIHGNKIHKQFIEENWDITRLAKELGNETAIYMGDFEPEDFDFIGFVDDYDNSLEHLSRLMNWDAPLQKSVENVTHQKKIIELNSETESELRIILSEEIDIYERSKEIFGERRV